MPNFGIVRGDLDVARDRSYGRVHPVADRCESTFRAERGQRRRFVVWQFLAPISRPQFGGEQHVLRAVAAALQQGHDPNRLHGDGRRQAGRHQAGDHRHGRSRRSVRLTASGEASCEGIASSVQSTTGASSRSATTRARVARRMGPTRCWTRTSGAVRLQAAERHRRRTACTASNGDDVGNAWPWLRRMGRRRVDDVQGHGLRRARG